MNRYVLIRSVIATDDTGVYCSRECKNMVPTTDYCGEFGELLATDHNESKLERCKKCIEAEV